MEAEFPLFLGGHYATELPGIRCLLENLGQGCGVRMKLTHDPGSEKLF